MKNCESLANAIRERLADEGSRVLFAGRLSGSELELGRAVNMVMCRALQACGDIRFPTVICVIDAWLVGVGGSFFLGVVLDWGLAGLWVAMAADECIRAVLFLIRWQSGAWRQKRLLDGAQG